jgi:hypothetical protein
MIVKYFILLLFIESFFTINININIIKFYILLFIKTFFYINIITNSNVHIDYCLETL